MRSNRCFTKGAGVAAVVVAVLASQAMAYTPVPLKLTYTVGLGGDNHASDWKSGTRLLYSGYNTASGQSFYQGANINWCVMLKAEGDHLASDGSYYRIFGAANTVFDLQLFQADGVTPATGAVFHSTINNGTGSDPTAAAAFALSFKTLSSANPPGRLIDKLTSNGPRMEPIFTYPFYDAAAAMLIGQGAGYKEWVRTGSNLSLYAYPGVGMDLMPQSTIKDGVGNTRAGLGVVPIAEGQIDMSGLPKGTYVLKVSPGKGNNVLRGDLPMLDPTNRPAFAIGVPENQTQGATITFDTNGSAPVTPGVKGRYVFYNNSAWDGNTPGISVPGDYNAIAPDKEPLLPGQTSSFKNYISYTKGLNGIIVDAIHINRLPVYGQDMICLYANAQSDPFTWTSDPGEPTMVLRPGEGVNGSDRLIMTWPDNAIPNTRWLLVALLADDPSFGLPESDYFIFGLAIGEVNGDYLVKPQDELLIRSNPRTALNPATIDLPYDINRDKKVDPTDQLKCRSNQTVTLNGLKALYWPPL